MKVVVLGSGESGTGAALLAAKQGYAVWVSDAGAMRPAHRDRLLAAGIPFEEGGHTLDRMRDAALVVKSPGIPDRVPIVESLRSLGIPVIGEIEFAYRFLPEGSKIIGITGSNGKTTTTLLTYHLLLQAGIDVALGGNVGRSFAALLLERPYAWYVLELSSFQLDGITDFRSDIGMLLNISPDHLDRYEYRMELYVASKFRPLIRWLYNYTFTDLGPFRAIRYSSLEALDMQDKNFGWTVEMQVKAARQRLVCREVAVTYRQRIGVSKVSGTVKGTIMAGYKILYTIFKLL